MTDTSVKTKARLPATTKKHQPQFAPLDKRHKGKLDWIAVKELTIPDQGDLGYQREAVPGHSTKIAAEFDWRLFGVIDVVKRNDLGGRLEVADGGNRVRAVKIRTDIPEVPCIIHEANSNQEAATIFTGININRKAISFAPLHKAMLIAKDAKHQKAQIAWDKLNVNGSVIFEPMKPIVTFCKRPNEHEAMQRMIPVFQELKLAFPKDRITADFFKGLVTLEILYAQHGSLSEPRWVKKMKRLGLGRLTDFSGAQSASGRHPRLFAQILADKGRLNLKPFPFETRR